MKNIVFVILDEFADWEAAFLSSALNDKNITKNYTTNFASIDKNLKKSMGNLKVSRQTHEYFKLFLCI